MNAVARMTPLPKNLVMMNTKFGILRAGTRFERIGKKAPRQISISSTDEEEDTECTGNEDNK
jgi:hypothetical protein